jgi:hypothetical protein
MTPKTNPLPRPFEDCFFDYIMRSSGAVLVDSNTRRIVDILD